MVEILTREEDPVRFRNIHGPTCGTERKGKVYWLLRALLPSRTAPWPLARDERTLLALGERTDRPQGQERVKRR